MELNSNRTKVVFCCPTYGKGPHEAFLESMKATVPLLDEHDIEHKMVFEVNCPYISHARATMLRKALARDVNQVIFLDHDVSWRPEDLLRLIQTDGDVVSGTYRVKKDEEEYMGTLKSDDNNKPITRDDGCVLAEWIPAGFMKITSEGVLKFMQEYPELVYGPAYHPGIDLFNHGAYNGLWYGEDYAFSRRWNDKCGEIWIIPDMDIDHHKGDEAFKGNFHEFLLRQPGGSEHVALS